MEANGNLPKVSFKDDHVTFDPEPKEPVTLTQASDPRKERATWSGKAEFLLTAVGFAVGLGNVWRFPHLCYSNGGGAFLIPYTLMLALAGLPLFFLELAFGQYASLGTITIWRVCPLFKGLGYTMVAVSLLVALYYNVIIGFCLFYFFASFTSHLPWTDCRNHWNTIYCSEDRFAPNPDGNGSLADNSTMENATMHDTDTERWFFSIVANTTVFGKPRAPAVEYWENYVLGMEEDTNIGHLGGLRWHVSLCLMLAWIIVFLCILKGIKTSGKVVYFTATFPYVILFILFVKGLTLSGAGQGIKYYLKPDFKKMGHVKVWKDAAVQILYSLGPGFGGNLTMGSFNKFKNNCYKDAIIVAVINCGTSVFAGFVIFAVLGHMAQESGVRVDKVVENGPGLAFIAYPEGLALMPAAPVWSILFFFMLFILGLGSQFPGIQCISTGLTDEFPNVFRNKTLVTFFICLILFLCGLPCVTRGGMYVVELIDKFSTSFPLLITTCLEAVILSWIYGYKRFSNDIEAMLGFRPNLYWILCWACFTPVIILFILIFSCIEYEPMEYHGYHYPGWAQAIGWLLVVLTLSLIPIWMVIKICKCIGSWHALWWAISGIHTFKSLNLRSLIEPSEHWGPALLINRVPQQVSEAKVCSEDQSAAEASNDARVVQREDVCILDRHHMHGSYI